MIDALRQCPDRHLAGRAIRERPVRPVIVIKSKCPSELDGIDLKAVEDVAIHDGELLLNVIDADWSALQPEVVPKSFISYSGNAGRTVTGKVDRHTIGLLVIQCRQHPISRVHDISFVSLQDIARAMNQERLAL